jgi:hypothetical protein
MNDEFYIGWEPKAAPGIGKAVRKAVIGLFILALLVPMVLAISQHMIGASVFEWGMVKKFSGVLELQPYPHLLVPRPGEIGTQTSFSTYYLVAPFKFGLDREKLSALDGKNVSLQGTLIYRGNQTMVEALPDSIKATDNQLPSLPGTETIGLGSQTLIGEIVDSKCFLGVMNPGQLTPHRACAIRCISGGVPPVLLVRQKDGPAIYLLIVSAAGKPVNQQVLDLVAEPLEITGEVERQGDLLILRADPATYRRVKAN